MGSGGRGVGSGERGRGLSRGRGKPSSPIRSVHKVMVQLAQEVTIPSGRSNGLRRPHIPEDE